MSDHFSYEAPTDPHLTQMLAAVRAAVEQHMQAVKSAVEAYVQAVVSSQQKTAPPAFVNQPTAFGHSSADPHLEQKLAAIRALAAQHSQGVSFPSAGAYLASGSLPTGGAYLGAASSPDAYLEQKLAAIRGLIAQRSQSASLPTAGAYLSDGALPTGGAYLGAYSGAASSGSSDPHLEQKLAAIRGLAASQMQNAQLPLGGAYLSSGGAGLPTGGAYLGAAHPGSSDPHLEQKLAAIRGLATSQMQNAQLPLGGAYLASGAIGFPTSGAYLGSASATDSHLEQKLAAIRGLAAQRSQEANLPIAGAYLPAGGAYLGAAHAGSTDPYLEQKLAAIRTLAASQMQSAQMPAGGAYLASPGSYLATAGAYLGGATMGVTAPTDPYLEQKLAAIRTLATQHTHDVPMATGGAYLAAGAGTDPHLEQKLAAIRTLATQHVQGAHLPTVGAYLGADTVPLPMGGGYVAAPQAASYDPHLEQKLAAIRTLVTQRTAAAHEASAATPVVGLSSERLTQFETTLAGVQESLEKKIHDISTPEPATAKRSKAGSSASALAAPASISPERLEQIRSALSRVQAQLVEKTEKEQAAAEVSSEPVAASDVEEPKATPEAGTETAENVSPTASETSDSVEPSAEPSAEPTGTPEPAKPQRKARAKKAATKVAVKVAAKTPTKTPAKTPTKAPAKAAVKTAVKTPAVPRKTPTRRPRQA